MAREKTVYPTDEIAHLWAHQSRDSARNPQDNHRFNGELLYSYAEPIGRIASTGRSTRNPSGPSTVALYRNQSWSNTTSRHQHGMRMATSHMQNFTVADIGAVQRWENQPSKINHKLNLKTYAARIITTAKRTTRARANKQWQLEALSALVTEANNYSGAFGLATRFAVPSDVDMAKLSEQAKREAELAARKNAAARKEREAREAAFRLEVLTALPQWLAGHAVDWKYVQGFRSLGETYMRIEGADVVTTLGARVPVEHVQRTMPIVLRLFERGEAYQCNGHSIPVGHYVLDSIGTDGVVRVGCHTFQRSEVERMAKVVAGYQPQPLSA